MITSVCVLDSGVNLNHKRLYPHRHKFILYDVVDNEIKQVDTLEDKIGHGTAVSAILSSVDDIVIHCFKVFRDDMVCDEKELIFTLNYIYQNLDCDIINLSLGTATFSNDLKVVCEKLFRENVIIVAAFENNGLISYPAALPFVIGVDSHAECVKNTDLVYVDGSNIVNVFGFGNVQRVAWVNPDYVLNEGTSFAAANITKVIMNGQCHSFSQAIDFLSKYTDKRVEIKGESNFSKKMFSIAKAVVFPHSKETDCLINNLDKHSFDIVGIYDLKHSGKIGRNISRIKEKTIIVNDFNSLNWNEEFDTIIVGHLAEYSKRLHNDLLATILEKCERHKKNIFCFDDLTPYEPINSDIKCYYPKSVESFKNVTLNRMHYVNSPVLGVFGTSSQQGKFSLQLSLRKKLKDKGYKVGQLGSEPTSLLFGIDEVYPYGYENSIKLNRGENILYINHLMHMIDSNSPDIILVGSQTNTISYCSYDYQQIPVMQNEFMTATNPDYVVLCINPFDETAYIENTIKYIEGLCNCDVIALALFPFDFQNDWAKAVSRRKKLASEEVRTIIDKLSVDFKLRLFVIGNDDSEEELVNYVIDKFAGA
ncbi:MAG: DUF1611 domain-containing protein [Bacilli bacterium]|nr:DUF1611 domain-containing protein [Bacilli bacterium]